MLRTGGVDHPGMHADRKGKLVKYVVLDPAADAATVDAFVADLLGDESEDEPKTDEEQEPSTRQVSADE
jgi:hypothetical protein